MAVDDTLDSGLPEATLFIGGLGLNPEEVTRVIGAPPHKVSSGVRPRWFWTSAGKIRSANADDHLRAVLHLVKTFARHRRAFPNVELRTSLFLPHSAACPRYSETLVRRLRRYGEVTLNLSDTDDPIVCPSQFVMRTKTHSTSARTMSRSSSEV